jgi:hypothetical protein
MKLHWFHLMPYPDLPADFQQENRSVWVDAAGHLVTFEKTSGVVAAIRQHLD